MADRAIVHSDRAPAAIGPYSQAVKAGTVLYCSGQIPLDPATGELVGGGDVAKETVQVLDNLKAVLETGGSSLANVTPRRRVSSASALAVSSVVAATTRVRKFGPKLLGEPQA